MRQTVNVDARLGATIAKWEVLFRRSKLDVVARGDNGQTLRIPAGR